MRLLPWLLPWPVVAAVAIACSDAPQGIQGGTPQFNVQFDLPNIPFPPPDGGDAEAGGCMPTNAANATWTSLYADLFGPTSLGQCGDSSRGDSNGSSSCHHDSGGNGALSSGFVCGDTQDSCYQGITSPMAQFLGARVVIACDPDNSFLPKVLRHTGGGIMPFYPNSVTFSDADLARVKAWIAAGAPNN
jgi:hypothetical protein